MSTSALSRTASLALAAVILPITAPVRAAVVDFSGSMSAPASVAPNAACAPIPFQGLITAGVGASSLGNFTYSHTVCTTGATGPVSGTYTIDFGADQFSGALAGSSAATATTGLFDLLFTYTITAGTGRFAGGTGSFIGAGTADVRHAPPSIVNLSFSAVPEPGTWAMMLLGFGAIGMVVRRRRISQPTLKPA
jgi:hypothetical protein